MATTALLAMLALDAYEDVPSMYGNGASAPSLTGLGNQTTNPFTGFFARLYQVGNEIIIAIRGSNDTVDWLTSTIPANLGARPAQLADALALYDAVKAQASPGTTITLTGHSLGGGLASAVAVLRNTTAEVFDAVPSSSFLAKIRMGIPSLLGPGGALPLPMFLETIFDLVQSKVANYQGVKNHRLKGDIATSNLVHQPVDYVGLGNGTEYLSSLQPAVHDKLWGAWQTLHQAPFSGKVFPTDLSIALHSQGLVALAASRNTSLSSMLTSQPYLLRQMTNDLLFRNLNTKYDAWTFAGELALDNHKSPTASNFLAIQADVNKLTALGSGSRFNTSDVLSTTMLQLTLSHAGAALLGRVAMGSIISTATSASGSGVVVDLSWTAKAEPVGGVLTGLNSLANYVRYSVVGGDEASLAPIIEAFRRGSFDRLIAADTAALNGTGSGAKEIFLGAGQADLAKGGRRRRVDRAGRRRQPVRRCGRRPTLRRRWKRLAQRRRRRRLPRRGAGLQHSERRRGR